MKNMHTPGLEHEVVVPGQNDYHGHPNYLKVYLGLLGFFALTVLASLLHNPMIVFVVVFSISIIKGSMVLLYFMHLKWEPKLTWLMLGLALVVLGFLFIGVFPDLVPVKQVLINKP